MKEHGRRPTFIEPRHSIGPVEEGPPEWPLPIPGAPLVFATLIRDEIARLPGPDGIVTLLEQLAQDKIPLIAAC